MHLIPQLIDARSRDLIRVSLDLARCAQYTLDRVSPADHNHYSPDTSIVNNCWDCYGHQVTEAMLALLTHRFSQVWDRDLIPSYSYARYHWTGAELRPHKDRAGCEYSATVMIACDQPWPIYMAGQAQILSPGDAYTYRGEEVEHWREPFAGNECLIMTLHWVDADGPYADHRFDQRAGLGMPPVRLHGETNA